MADKNAPLIPQEGWHCLHLFYRIDFAQWQLLSADEQRTAKVALSEIVQEIRATEKTQLLTLSVVMEPVYSYLSLTEESEYTTAPEQYAETLASEQNLKAGTPEFEAAMKSFAERMAHYRQERVYPTLPDWPVVCFYNMSKRRGEQRNWYALPFDDRRKLMGGHAKVGREFTGKVKQLITGSTGLDDAEWGVTLFARDTFQIKKIVYEMRFDRVSADYADFGEFFVGIQLPLDELFRRLQL
ncbi:MAG: heme peroxidase [Verrucomicrobia bacterium]|nr:MAG: heme peroxidase [Verrucomicrobiota bacterium]